MRLLISFFFFKFIIYFCYYCRIHYADFTLYLMDCKSTSELSVECCSGIIYTYILVHKIVHEFFCCKFFYVDFLHKNRIFILCVRILRAVDSRHRLQYFRNLVLHC